MDREGHEAVRDLLAVDVRPGDWLPVDDSGDGFDNIAEVLSTSSALLDRYMSAAHKISQSSQASMLPDTLRWQWSGYPRPITPGAAAPGAGRGVFAQLVPRRELISRSRAAI